MLVSKILEKWYLENRRDLPWRRSDSPYHIWLSEIILQQTRVAQGTDYYNRFVERFPTVTDLANAPMDEVLKLWQGLGYYTRARNLHETARKVVNDHGGIFPRKHEELAKLKGVGTYTAAAIASIAFGEPVALVDGNVYRVLSRLYGIHDPIDSPYGKRVFKEKAEEILNRERPDIHNQALMEFGALICLPRNPDCRHCVLSHLCKANCEGKTNVLPVKEGKVKTKARFFNYLFIRHKGYTYLNKRLGNDIWNSLYEFPLIESETPVDYETLTSMPAWKVIFGKTQPEADFHPRTYRHQLTHQTLHCSFYQIRINREPDRGAFRYQQIPLEGLAEYAVPRVIDKYLADLHQEGIL
jgi:A/G-specific adenine glycosylase